MQLIQFAIEFRCVLRVLLGTFLLISGGFLDFPLILSIHQVINDTYSSDQTTSTQNTKHISSIPCAVIIQAS